MLTNHTAHQLDQHDQLAHFVDRFVVHDEELIYLLGNSLGRLPRATVQRMHRLVHEEWGERLIRGWNEGWMDLPQRLGDKLATLLGAQSGEVIVADSTSVNLYKVVRAALALRPGRNKVVTDDLNFPSDLYVLQGAVGAQTLHFVQADGIGPAGSAFEERDNGKQRGISPVQRRIEVVRSPDGIHGPLDGLQQAIDEETALVALSHTAFKSSYVYEMAAVTSLAHEAGALVVWDLSHSAGAVDVDLEGAGADFAVGCTYKYLCGGPGAPAFLYVRQALQHAAQNPVSGWMGQARPFDFELQYEPASGVRRFLTGTPSIFSMAAIEPGLDILLEAGMSAVRAKSARQTAFLLDLFEQRLRPLGFEWRSPRDEARRGSHIALGHPEAMRISEALKNELNVLPDFRRPDNLRLSVAPLYTSYVQLFEAVQRIARVIEAGMFEKYPPEAPPVT